MDALHMVELFVDIAADVRTAIDRQADWGLSGKRPGQYTIDLDADAVVVGRLRKEGFAVLSEESGLSPSITEASGSSGITIVVDPIDGSTNASAGLPWFATSLCAVDADGPLASVVVNQASGARWHAVRGQGAFRDGRPIAPAATTELPQALVAVSGLPERHLGWDQFRCYGAAALDICAVADGTFDAFADLSVDAHGSWDYLGAMLVLIEAGGAIVDRHDRELVTVVHEDRRTPIAAASSALLGNLRRQLD